MTLLLTLLTFLLSVAHADLPAGARIDQAVVVDITDDGFDAISQALPAFVPDSIDVPDIVQSGRALYDWDLTISGMDARVAVQSAAIRPGDGNLDILARLTLALNDSSQPARVRFVYRAPWWLGGPWTLTDCNFYLRPVTVDLATRAWVSAEPTSSGRREIRVTVGTVDWSWSLRGSDLRVSNCFLGTIDEILDIIGVSLFDLVTGPLRDIVNDQIQELVRDLGPELEDALNSFRIDERFDINGAEIAVQLDPTDVEVIPAGLRLVLGGSVSADEHPCIAANNIQTSRSTASPVPGIRELPAGIDPHDIGILADDDFVNQALFAVYRAGALCLDLEGAQAGLPLDTSLLGILAPGSFDDLFAETRPLRLELRPLRPPTGAAGGGHDLTVQVRDLQLDVYGELDGRMAALLGIDLEIDAGVDLRFDGSTGSLNADVALSGDNLRATGRPNQIVPGAEVEAAARIGNLFDVIAGPLLGGALSGLGFDLPAFSGFGLQRLQIAAAGPAGDWVGAYAAAGTVPYGSAGCGDGGCDGGSDGCAQGCSPLAAGGRGLALVVIPLIVALLRRRR